MAYNILSLLPYSEHSELSNKSQKLNDLYFIKSVVDLAILALDSFIVGNLKLFDAQVGENLCQIRAYKILHLKNRYHSESQENLLKEAYSLREYKNKLEEVIIFWEKTISQAFSYDKNLDGLEYIHDFLDRHHLFLPLSQDAVFIICCFFLEHFCIRKKNIPIAINLNFISRELHISKYRAKRLIHKYQLIICDLGCDFVITIANKLYPNGSYPAILSRLRQISDEERSVLPCYMVSEIIFYHCITNQIPVLFIINRVNSLNEINHVIYFLLVGQNHTIQFSLQQSDHGLSDHCLVVSGRMHYADSTDDILTNFVNHVLTQTPLKLILANTASHPQYAGVRLKAFQHNPFLLLSSEEYIEDKHSFEKTLVEMQLFASNNGCSANNPTLFFLEHIYASKIIEEITQLKTTYQNRVYNAIDLTESSKIRMVDDAN